MPPQYGRLIVNQTEVKALTDGILLQMVEWVDIALPLAYKFGYYGSSELYN